MTPEPRIFLLFHLSMLKSYRLVVNGFTLSRYTEDTPVLTCPGNTRVSIDCVLLKGVSCKNATISCSYRRHAVCIANTRVTIALCPLPAVHNALRY